MLHKAFGSRVRLLARFTQNLGFQHKRNPLGCINRYYKKRSMYRSLSDQIFFTSRCDASLGIYQVLNCVSAYMLCVCGLRTGARVKKFISAPIVPPGDIGTRIFVSYVILSHRRFSFLLSPSRQKPRQPSGPVDPLSVVRRGPGELLRTRQPVRISCVTGGRANIRF